MDLRAEFKNGGCKLYLTPSDDWEEKLLGAVAKGGNKLEAIVTYKPEGHFTHGQCKAVHILLQAGNE